MFPKRDTTFYQTIECYLHRLFPQVQKQSLRCMTDETRQKYIKLLRRKYGCKKEIYKMSLQDQYLIFLLENDFKDERSLKSE